MAATASAASRLDSLRTVALSDQPVPGFPEHPIGVMQARVLSDQGRVAFSSVVQNRAVIFSEQASGELRAVATDQASNLSWLSGGEIVFSGSNVLENRRVDVVYRLGDDGFTQLAGPPFPAVDQDGNAIPGQSQMSAHLAAAHPSGQYLVSATIANEAGRPANFATYQGHGDVLRLLVPHGGQAPGTPEGTLFTDTTAFTWPHINQHGDVVIGSKLDAGDAVEFVNDTGIWFAQDGELALLYRQGDPVPGAEEGELFGPFPAHPSSSIALNDAGDIAFSSGLATPDGNNSQAAFARRGGRLDRVAEVGQIAPGTSSALFDNSGFSNLAINASGQTAFAGRVTGGELELWRKPGIWTETNNGLVLVALEDQPVPEADEGLLNVAGEPFQFNAHGQIALAADYRVGDEVRRGVFAFDTDQVLKPVLLPGDPITIAAEDTRIVTRAEFASLTGGNQDGLPSSFNERGQILVRAQFTDGSFGLFVSDFLTVPEPLRYLDVDFPSGNRSFPDRVLLADKTYSGNPAPGNDNPDPTVLLNTPVDETFYSLGDGGLVALEFVDNLLVNSGDSRPDLFFNEVRGTPERFFAALRPLPEVSGLLDPARDDNGDGYYSLGSLVASRIVGDRHVGTIDIDAIFPGFAAGTLKFDAIQLVDDPNEGSKEGATVGVDLNSIAAIFSEVLLDKIGDLDFDGQWTIDDLDRVQDGVVRRRREVPAFDVNNDGNVNVDDTVFWVHNLKRTYLGDANLDGEFNSADLIEVFAAGQYEDGVRRNSTWASGDWNSDAEFDSSDLVSAFADGGYEQGPRAVVAVPEPAAWRLAVVGSLCGLRTRGRRSKPIRDHE
jgi:hypothetical protein